MATFKQDDSKYQDGEPPVPVNLDEQTIISPDTLRKERIPPGQQRTRKWPVLHYAFTPEVELENWRLEIKGLVKTPLRLTWQEFQNLPRVQVFADFHCVTRWSRLGNLWEGVSIQELIHLVEPDPAANFVVATGYDSGWTTNIPLDEFRAEDALLADLHDGQPISPDHGGPLRLIIPQLYAWKSAKWVKRLEFLAEDTPGYWEQMGYHNHGDPWTEERYSW